MTVSELMVLNMALDGKDIFGFPSFESTGKSELLIQSVKKALIEKGMLENETSFTMEGVRYVKWMKDYKEAKKYVSLGIVILGVSEDKKTIMLESAGDPAEYEFRPADISECFQQISNLYHFLKINSKKTGKAISQDIRYEDLMDKYALDHRNALFISTYDQKGAVVSDEIFFLNDKGLCYYDCIVGTLTEKYKEAEKIIRERMA